jgi:hypothetical protein
MQERSQVNVHGGWGPWINVVHGWGSPMGKQLEERNAGIAIVSQPIPPSSHDWSKKSHRSKSTASWGKRVWEVHFRPV